jgi:hypothetical protein
VGDGVAVVLAVLVVKALVHENVAPFLKMSHDAAVNCDVVMVVARLEGFVKDGIAVCSGK